MARYVIDERAVVLPLGRIGDTDQVAVDVVAARGRARVHLGAGARHRALLVALEALQTVCVGVGVAPFVVRQRVLQHVAGRVVAVVVEKVLHALSYVRSVCGSTKGNCDD